MFSMWMGVDVAAAGIRVLLSLLGGTSEVRFVAGRERLEALVDADDDPVILVVWHHQLFLASYVLWRRLVRRGVRVTVLVSRSRDGAVAARLGEMLGVRMVRGSTSRGAATAVRQLHRAIVGDRNSLLLFPDGPRGPSRQFQPGAANLSRLTGAPILPLGLGARRRWRLGSWDRMILPKPFTTIEVVVGEPYVVARGDRDIGAECRHLGDRLDALERRVQGARATG